MGEPQRQCIVSGESFPQSALLRFAITPDDAVIVDVEAKLPGRGVWLTPDRESLQQAIKTNAFARSAKMQLSVSDGLAEQVHKRLHAKAMETLHLCRKAGLLVQGFEKVKAELEREKVAVLLQANDAKHDGKAKLAKLYEDDLKRCDWFSRDALGQVMGRDEAVHLALAPHKLTSLFWRNAQRFAGFIETDAL